MSKVATLSTRTLRSSRRKLEVSSTGETTTEITSSLEIITEPQTAPIKRRKTSKTPSKYNYKQFEKELFEKYPIPKDVPLVLPESYASSHQPDFIKGLEFILSKDPSLYPLIVHKPFEQFHPDSKPSFTTQDYFQKVCRSIIGQQISGSAALSIERKFRELYEDKFPTPVQVSETSLEDLRNSGLSTRKVEYVKSAAHFFLSEEDLQFEKLTNEEIIDKLVQIKGIGEWSAKMFLAFSLKRLDVFAIDDLGVARGVSRYVDSRPWVLDQFKSIVKLRKSKFDDKKKRDWKVINDAYVELLSDDFKPYRTVLMLIMWRVSSTNIQVLT